MKNVTYPLLLAAVCSLAMTEVANAAALFEETVFCGEQECGTMKINTYEAFENTVGTTKVGGVTIDGKFHPTALGNFHYIRAIIVDDVPIPFTDGTALPIPYIDTPPGGYQGQPFDFLPYYDEGNEFPSFFDAPRNPLADAIGIGGDGEVNVQFETWLVCVIDEMFGANPNQAQDDAFTVAPLLGWTWGYSTENTDDGDANPNEFEDFTTMADAFNFIGVPSVDWTTALGQTYGAGANQDSFNVILEDCEDCEKEPIPEPSSTLGLLALGTLGAGLTLLRKQKQQKSEEKTLEAA